MKTRVGINGFGRIGRQVFKSIRERYGDELEVVAINDLFSAEMNAHLLRHDTNYGAYPGTVEVKDGNLIVDGDEVRVYALRNPADLPWGELGVEIVVESTGVFRKREQAALHLDAGAKKVIISAPATAPDLTVVLGVNEEMYDPKKHNIISNASCTTNCLAPAAKAVHDAFGIERGVLTTVHSYTNDQRILDLPHKDFRRARAAAMNIIPTTTGAAKAVALVIPELEGRFDGMAMRVPTSTVSIVDFVAVLKKNTTTEALHEAFQAAADGRMKGILNITSEPLVSSDYKGTTFSSIVDAPFTKVYGENMVKVLAWYDNEWGYSTRVADLTHLIAEKGF